ncbi:putative transmembrane anti-sigma factor [Cellulomonas flavigena DSM 20109]|uniref:Putative transmembrane anti-sigma factor n=1 Tax=Cellulomonas flavigena (strain ATCC 482 / DSM 20109 / BCRC 11376 / JCM 18109 / NBRC 3775 / NCIMB 8073 / NRS 134) TaxID=446466 RepID=D5UDD5_CELFN|nr:zf-HC2 domain-containing protein [Cellulomonas flavigena]ADG76391.1 putative transmembrane anti-sigma factor [Cellulomonas flavigena DSM 20109]
MSTDPYREWDAAYVLGALPPGERRDYEAHLATCDACRTAVGELAGLPGLLGQVPAQDAVASEDASGQAPGATGPGPGRDRGRVPHVRAVGPSDTPPADAPPADVVPLASLAQEVRRRRARRRLALAGAAAALVVLAGVAGAAVTGGLGAPPAVVAADARTVALAPVGGSGVSADVTIAPARWGTRLDWSCAYEAAVLPEGVYELVLVGADGERSVVATWTSTGERTASGLQASSALPVDGIARVELGVVGLGRPLAVGDVGA